MRIIYTLLFLLISLVSFGQFQKTITQYRLNPELTESDYKSKTIILKEKREFRGVLANAPFQQAVEIDQVMQLIGSNEATRIYPNHQKVGDKKDKHGLSYVDLSLMYQIEYNADIPLEKVINTFLSLGCFEYVEPLFLHELLYVADDPDKGLQYHINLIKAPEAWDVTQGDTSIVIGITDTGFLLDHPDIDDAIKYNYNDPIDGIDNDGDGYTDNFYGWDLGDGDSDPSIGTSNHGLWVAGIAAAETDNATFGVGVGFKTKFLPVKIMDAASTLAQAYPGIVYAADHGCAVINCSWGSANSWSQYGQDIINYATVNQGALVVAAAGNSNLEEPYYPAAYDNVISCATTDSTDIKNNWATHHKTVDVCGTGGWMYSTKQNYNFGSVGSGSSFSAPVVSAVAALVKSQFPTYSPLQIGEQIKATTDDIYGIPANASYEGLLGTGRVNAFRAVTESGTPAIYMINEQYSSPNGLVFASGDTVTLTGDFINYLSLSGVASASLTSNSAFINVISGSSTLGAISTLSSVDNSSEPFVFEILGGAPNNTNVELIITITDDMGYTHEQCLSITINRNYADMDVNNLLMTITSKGRFGYNSANQADGSGLTYQGSAPMFWEMNFMVAHSTTQVSFDRDDEFQIEESLSILKPGLESDKDMRATFNDDPASNKLKIKVKQKALGWDDAGKENFIICEFNIINTDTVNLDSIYPALYTDWDIDVWNENYAGYDSINHTGYVYHPGGNWGGVRLLTDYDEANYYAFNNDGANGSMNIYDGYSQTEQYNSVSNGIQRDSASFGDVGHIIGAGPININAGDSVLVAFAVLAGTSLDDLKDAGEEAQTTYDDIRRVIVSLQSLSNVSCYSDCDGEVQVSSTYGIPPYSYSWNDPSGQTSETASGLCPGQYIVTVVDAVGNMDTQNVIVGEPSMMSLSISESNNVSCYGLCDGDVSVAVSGGTASYAYQWSDPSIQGIPDPNLCAGEYTLYVTDANNCLDSIQVVITEPLPLESIISDSVSVSNTGLCDGEATVLASGGTTGYTYLWNDSLSQDSSVANSLCEGNYMVTVTDANGCEVTSTVEIDNPNGILDWSQSGISVFPNPVADDRLNVINQSNASIEMISIYNSIGQLLHQENVSTGQLSINTEQFENGIYFLVIDQNGKQWTQKIEILR